MQGLHWKYNRDISKLTSLCIVVTCYYYYTHVYHKITKQHCLSYRERYSEWDCITGWNCYKGEHTNTCSMKLQYEIVSQHSREGILTLRHKTTSIHANHSTPGGFHTHIHTYTCTHTHIHTHTMYICSMDRIRHFFFSQLYHPIDSERRI